MVVTEHGCESGAYCHTFLYKAHFEREREERRSNSGSNSQFVVHQRGGSKRVLAKAHFYQVLPQGYCPFSSLQEGGEGT